MSGIVCLFAAFALIASPTLLIALKNGVADEKSFLFSAIAFAVAAFLPLFGFGDAGSVYQVLLAQTLLFFTYVSVSRMRQRKSAFLHAVASIGSNGGWFLVMFVLAGAYVHAEHTLHGGALSREFVGYLAASVAGILGGRLAGVQWMQWVEQRWKVGTETVGHPVLQALDKRTLPTLLGVFVLCPIVLVLFGLVPLRDVAIVTVLGFVQNGVYAFNTRLANRDHPAWPVVTGLVGGVVFIVHWTYLLGYTSAGGIMPLTLLVPYTVATVAGSNAGAFISMLFEKKQGITADRKASYKGIIWHRYVLGGVAALCVAYLVLSVPFLGMFGLAAHHIALPFGNVVRPLALVLGGLVFFTNNVTHTLSSRAGNRNHAAYHALTCLLHGFVTFLMGTFVVLNAHFLDLIPVAAFGSASGQLFAQRVSLWVEAQLGSVMDLPPEPKKVKA
ncbi:MAG: hypothetical protein B7W98_00725 [Parcubacteria group bacterium 20-58-5]|nr:MAG: hypothetical protein B7W98_00725 [Parcubacteria group bacterium 20-58-5]